MDAFLAPAARLFVVDRNLAGRVVVSVNYEALPTRWERLHQWLLTNLENLRTRAQVSANALAGGIVGATTIIFTPAHRPMDPLRKRSGVVCNE